MRNVLCFKLAWLAVMLSFFTDSWANGDPGQYLHNHSRPVFFEFHHKIVDEFFFDLKKSDAPSEKGEVEFVQQSAVKLNFPIWLGKQFKLAGGLRYYRNQYTFDEDWAFSDPRVVSALEKESLKRFGVRLYSSHGFSNKRRLMFRFAVDLNSEDPKVKNFVSDFLKLSVSGIYSYHRTDDVEKGIGLALGYEWGRPLVLPAFRYYRTFKARHNLQVQLPQYVRYRYFLSYKSSIGASVELKGASYTLNGDDAGESERLEINQSDLVLESNWSQEIHDWIWYSLGVGMHYNLRFDVVEPYFFSPSDPILESKRFASPFLEVKLFCRMPRNFLKD